MANERLRALEEVEKEIAMVLQCAGEDDLHCLHDKLQVKCIYFVLRHLLIKTIVKCVVTGNIVLELSKDKHNASLLDRQLVQFQSSVNRVESELSGQIRYLTQVTALIIRHNVCTLLLERARLQWKNLRADLHTSIICCCNNVTDQFSWTEVWNKCNPQVQVKGCMNHPSVILLSFYRLLLVSPMKVLHIQPERTVKWHWTEQSMPGSNWENWDEPVSWYWSYSNRRETTRASRVLN